MADETRIRELVKRARESIDSLSAEVAKLQKEYEAKLRGLSRIRRIEFDEDTLRAFLGKPYVLVPSKKPDT